MTAGIEPSDDAFLGGALQILQPRRAYRAGLDAVLLAASVPAGPGGRECRVLDAGAGVGVVGLAVAARLREAHVTLVERSPDLADLARRNADRNGLAGRVAVVEADVTRGGAAVHAHHGEALAPGSFDHVLANPPYAATGSGTRPPDQRKAEAHQMPAGDLDHWLRFLATACAADGLATLVHRADALAAVLAAMEGRFGALIVYPVFPREGEAATRILVRGRKGSRAPLTLARGLVLHDGDGNAFRAEAEAILRSGAGLRLA